ncbi:MAG: RimK family alpha-L-glutamate ligase, partial [Clostridia bacterium]|nr:RimK family alpha-L-glutamate ligase [Clostridia bacterium]
MKTGYLVVNHFLQTEKFTELYRRFCRSAQKRGIQLLVKTGAELLQDGRDFLLEKGSLPEFVLFWDKDVRLAYALENMGIRLFNSTKAIFLCDDKSMTHLALAGQVPMPKTLCAPLTYPGVGYGEADFVKEAVKTLGLPLVIKECFGSFGAQVYLIKTEEEAIEKAKSLAGVPFIMQEYVASSHGCDLRLQVVGNEVVCAMLRKNEQDFRANVSNGGSMEP